MDNTESFKPIEIFKDCKNYSDHEFVPYKVGTVQCKKCGKFAQIGFIAKTGVIGNERR